MAAWFSCVGDEDACWIFAVASSRPGLVGLVGLAGESRELCKWLQCCPLSSTWGLFFKIYLPGVIAGGNPLQKSIWEYQYGGKKLSICCCFLLLDILGSSIPVCRGSSCFLGVRRLCVHVFSHALPMCMHLSVFQQVACTPSSPISGIHACRMRRENQGCS